MSKFFYFTIISIFIAGCSPASKVETNVKTAETNAVINKTVVNNAVASSVNVSNENAPASTPNANITIQNFAIKEENIRNVKDKKGAAGADNAPIAPNVVPGVIKEQDGSEILNTMNAKGLPVERRTFKNHPVLLKIERTDLNNSDIKVYLKNGKVVVLPEGLANNFLTAPASDILKAVGLN